jgi:hypothetical protein
MSHDTLGVKELDTMPDAPKPHDIPAESEPREAQPATLWSGTGLCCEAQGDGIPCKGTDGECETCGRALPSAKDAG